MSRYTALSSCLVNRFTVSAADADAFVKEFFDIIKEYVEKDKIVKVKGLGTFKLVEVSAREMIDVNTRERITLSSKQRITFTPETLVRDRVNSPFSQFESIELDDDTDFSEIDSRYGMGEVDEEEKVLDTKVETPAVVDEEKPAEEEEPATQQDEAKEEPNASPPEPPNDDDNNDNDNDNDDNTTDNGDDDEYEATRRSRAPYVIIILIALVLIAAVGYFAYQVGIQRGFMEALPEMPEVVEEETLIEALPVDTIAEKDSVDVAAEEVEAVENEKNDTIVEIYYDDPRLRHGAYEIVGLDTIVRVLPGQTLRGISRAHFGDDMECYVEVYNGGITSVDVGDEVKIPKLRVKASVRGRMRH